MSLGAVSRTVLPALLLGSLMAVPWALPRPAALPLDAPPTTFSAERARRVVEAIAGEPRPTGSPAHARAREVLLREIEALGLEPIQHEAASERVEGGRLVNLLARVRGRDSTGVVLLAAHYDSVRRSPGAGDDAAGVAACLEALRALLARGAPRNDVVLLLSDGEERGLLGAFAFDAEHPWAREVALVVNLEAIGNAGPASLFETGPENGAVVRALARAVRAPVGGSFATAIYRAMPNDTDYSVFRARGIPGANLALTGNGRAYHSPLDTPEHLDPSGLQHLGETALDLLAEFAALDLAAARAPERHFVTFPGGSVLHLPAAWTPRLAWLAAVALLAAAWTCARRTLRAEGSRPGPWFGALALVLLPALLAGGLAAGVVALGHTLLGGWQTPGPPTSAAQVSVRLFAALAAGTALVLGVFSAWARGERGRAALRRVPAVASLAWLALLALFARGLGSEALLLPALAAFPAALGLALFHRERAALFLPLLAASLAAQSTQVAIQVSSTSPVQETIAVAAVVVLGLTLLAPWLARLALSGVPAATGAGLAAAGDGPRRAGLARP